MCLSLGNKCAGPTVWGCTGEWHHAAWTSVKNIKRYLLHRTEKNMEIEFHTDTSPRRYCIPCLSSLRLCLFSWRLSLPCRKQRRLVIVAWQSCPRPESELKQNDLTTKVRIFLTAYNFLFYLSPSASASTVRSFIRFKPSSNKIRLKTCGTSHEPYQRCKYI